VTPAEERVVEAARRLRSLIPDGFEGTIRGEYADLIRAVDDLDHPARHRPKAVVT